MGCDQIRFRPENRRNYPRKRFDLGPHGLPTRALRCHLGEPLLRPLFARPVAPKLTMWSEHVKSLNIFSHRYGSSKTPQTGMLKDRAGMSNLLHTDADYSCYCSGGNRKRTHLWNTAICPGGCDRSGHLPKHRLRQTQNDCPAGQ